MGSNSDVDIENVDDPDEDVNSDDDGIIDVEEVEVSLREVPSRINLFSSSIIQTTEIRENKRKIQVTDHGDGPNSKRTKIEIDLGVPDVNFSHFRGFPQILETVSQLIIHMKEDDIYKTLGASPPRGFLLHGPPGCGKTLLARAIAGELQIPLVSISASDMVPSVYNFSDYRIKSVFDSAQEKTPCVLFIDKMEAVHQRKEVTRQLQTHIDKLNDNNAKVMLIGATTDPNLVDRTLRMAGRFDREICLPIPDREARKEILQLLTSGMKLKEGLSIDEIAANTPGFVGADLKSLTTEAAVAAVNRIISEKMSEQKTKDHSKKQSTDRGYLPLIKSGEPLLSPEECTNIFINEEDFCRAVQNTQPSTKREGFICVPKVTWDDIGSLNDVRTQLQRSILLPVKHPDEFLIMGMTRATGVLLCGPPGCGKTLLAKAIANEANINFISVKGPELLSMYVGESERAVRECFQRAKHSQPCVIFFDEVDALLPKRGTAVEGSNITARVVNQILTEMDGIECRKGVYILAATNRPDILDPAVLRPGRFDKIIYVGLPSADDRVDILKVLTKNGTRPPMTDVNLEELGRDPLLDGYTGADLAALIREASVLALSDFMDHKIDHISVTKKMINDTVAKLRPSITKKDMQFYGSLKKIYGNRKESSKIN